ncbi:MAG: hypothetical protein AAF639_08040 [Chloroflexota bacterium]
MDANLALVIIVAILGLIAVFAFFRYRRSGQVRLKGPFDTELNLEAQNDKSFGSHAVNVEDAEIGSQAVVGDETGRGVNVKSVKIGGDLNATSKNTVPKD